MPRRVTRAEKPADCNSVRRGRLFRLFLAMKPFRPPLLRRLPTATDLPQEGPPVKKVKLECVAGSVSTPRLVFKKPGISSLPRKPLHIVNNLAVSAEPTQTEKEQGEFELYYSVLWYYTLAVTGMDPADLPY